MIISHRLLDYCLTIKGEPPTRAPHAVQFRSGRVRPNLRLVEVADRVPTLREKRRWTTSRSSSLQAVVSRVVLAYRAEPRASPHCGSERVRCSSIRWGQNRGTGWWMQRSRCCFEDTCTDCSSQSTTSVGSPSAADLFFQVSLSRSTSWNR